MKRLRHNALLVALAAAFALPRAHAMEVGTNYWVVAWGWPSADPFQEGYDGVTAVDPWKSEFLDETAFYTVHRFMDWNRTNGSDQVHWADRTQKADANQDPVAYEWMIDLCNRHGADLWVTVPHRTYEDQSYWTELAQLLLAELDPQLKVYVEYSNETWNGMFAQSQYARDQGVTLGLDADANRAGQEFHVYAAIRLFEAFEAVWGQDNPRLVKVIAGQSVNTWLTSVHLAALADATINPNATAADAYAIAPYFGNGASSIAELDGAVSGAIADVAAQADAIVGSGMVLIAYEGGQHVLSNAIAVNRDPAMYDLYTTYLEGIDDHIEVFAHYAHAGQFGDGGAWGAKESIGQDIGEAHKYRALVDYAAGHQPDAGLDGGVTDGDAGATDGDAQASPDGGSGPNERDGGDDPAGNDPDNLGGGCSVQKAAPTHSGIMLLLLLGFAGRRRSRARALAGNRCRGSRRR